MPPFQDTRLWETTRYGSCVFFNPDNSREILFNKNVTVLVSGFFLEFSSRFFFSFSNTKFTHQFNSNLLSGAVSAENNLEFSSFLLPSPRFSILPIGSIFMLLYRIRKVGPIATVRESYITLPLPW